MNSYQFTIVASGLDPNADDFADRFYEAGCDDATIAFQKGVILLEFDREAKSLAAAQASAIRNVFTAGANVDHIEPDYLVNLSDIAARCGLTRAAVSQYANGQRGEGFPPPIARITTDTPLWDWVAVARWLFQRKQIGRQALIEAKTTKAMNNVVARLAAGKHDRRDRAAA